MTIDVKLAGLYQSISGMSGKRSGAYEAVTGVFAKTGGAYGDNLLGSLPWRAVSAGVNFPRENFTQTGSPTLTSMMSRTFVPVHQNIPGFRLVLPHASWNSTLHTERIPSGVTTCRASWEWPIGTETQITVGGQDTFALANGPFTVTDFMPIAHAKGDSPVFRCWRVCDTPGELPVTIRLTTGDTATYGTSVADQTGGGTVANTGSLSYHPSAMIAQGNFIAPFLGGDSRCMGTNDTIDATGSLGELARSFGLDVGYVNSAVGSDRADWFINSHSIRASLQQYCSHVVWEMAVNNFGASQTAAQVLAFNKQIRNEIFPSLPFYQTTTTVAQSNAATQASYNAQRIAFNNLLRAGVADFTGFFDLANAIESATYNSGVLAQDGGWFASSTYTADFLHCSQPGYVAIRDSGLMRASMLA